MCDHIDSKAFYDGAADAGLRYYTSLLGFNSDSLELIESIMMLYGSKTQNQLILLTHSEQPWAEARAGIAPGERSEKELSLDTMYQYYLARYKRNREHHEA